MQVKSKQIVGTFRHDVNKQKIWNFNEFISIHIFTVPVAVDRPVPVEVPRPYPVTVERTVAVPVDRPVGVAVPHPVPVPVARPVGKSDRNKFLHSNKI